MLSLILALAGCVECALPLPQRATQGTLDDVTTEPGDYDGYRVEACEDRDFLVVVGTGTQEVDVQLIVDDVRAAFPSARDGSFGVVAYPSCRSDVEESAALVTDDYADVDALVAAVGAAFAVQDGAGVIEIGVEYIDETVPHED